VAAREAALVALPVRGDVLPVPHAQLLDRLLDHLVPALAPGRLGAEPKKHVSNSRYVQAINKVATARTVRLFFSYL
jgi:hypothetical protein